MMGAAAMSPALAQRFAALDAANAVRVRRRLFKVEVHARRVRIEDVLREPEWFLLSLPVHELLAWFPWIGASKTNKVLRKADVWPLRELGRLTVGQRERIVVELER